MSGLRGGLLTKRATFLFAIENIAGTNPGLDPEADAVEVSAPDFTTDINVIKRDFVSNDLSPFEDQIGRVISGFKVTAEARGNGRQQSGQLADRPILADLISACGYKLSAMTATGTDCHSPVVADFDNPKSAPRVKWVPTNDPTTNTAPVLYTVEVTTAGASGAAKVTVTSNTDAEFVGVGDLINAPAEQVLTTGVAISLGARGGKTTPTFAGALPAGLKWQIAVFPRGIKATPVSDDFPTASMELNKDGLYHEGNQGVGSFTLDATAGDVGKFTFSYTARFNIPTDDVMPEVDFGDLPLSPQIELSQFTWGGDKDLLVEKFTYDQGNQIEARPSVNHPNGYAGSRITARTPKLGFDPEATLEADHPFWDEFIRSKSKTLITRMGTEPGNQTVFFCGKTQTSEQPYADRNGTVTYNKSGAPKRINGNDETIIVFC